MCNCALALNSTSTNTHTHNTYKATTLMQLQSAIYRNRLYSLFFFFSFCILHFSSFLFVVPHTTLYSLYSVSNIFMWCISNALNFYRVVCCILQNQLTGIYFNHTINKLHYNQMQYTIERTN